MIKAVIYDLDDTMVVSDKLHREAWEVLLRRRGHSFDELPEAFRSSLIGLRLVDTASRITGQLRLDVDQENFLKERSGIFLRLVREKLEPAPGLFSSLSFFKSQGMRLAIASSGTREYISVVLGMFKLTDYFDVIVAGDEVRNGKPDPEIYTKACAHLGLAPSECLVLEDATLGICSAKAAGCLCMGVVAPDAAPQDRSGADFVIKSLEDVKAGLAVIGSCSASRVL